ncbi:MAG: transketolase [Bacilli bacterium]|nr:transketolase [Bacilli bacterium]
MASKNIDKLAIGAMRSLVIDQINKANSGHPGMALDAAPAMYALFRDHFVADPKDPSWINRDRLVFSSGHASSLLYSCLHLAGYDLSMDDLKQFRQPHSKTPGHPEIGVTPGVDAGAGPLGQGIGQGVGMAMAERAIAATYPDGASIMRHYTYVLCGDGCLEEGLSQEAISLAGHYKLNRLIMFYDMNGSTLDGPTDDSLSEDVRTRFLACEWKVLEVEDGNDVEAISKAIAKAKQSRVFPTLIILHTKIGYGSQFEGSSKTHGAPLGAEDGAFAKKRYGYEYPEFTVPEEVYQQFADTFAARGASAHAEHEKKLKAFHENHPLEAKLFDDSFAPDFGGRHPDWSKIEIKDKDATRNCSGKCLAAVHEALPFAFGGSADVAGSTKTDVKGVSAFTRTNPAGKDVRWGIREFAMSAAMNGILLHGGLLAYGACFFVFADYCKPALRMAALQGLPAIYIFSHDSLAVGEDGPTHQPIEQLAMLRAMPNVSVYRPADLKETMGAYDCALKHRKGPSAIITSRQNLPTLDASAPEKVDLGAYFALECDKPDCEIIATGSEVSLAIEASKLLAEKGIKAAVVSMPCRERFEEQGEEYRSAVLCCPREKRISLEMGATYGWGDLAALNIGVDRFGESGPFAKILPEYGFEAGQVAEKVANFIGGK